MLQTASTASPGAVVIRFADIEFDLHSMNAELHTCESDLFQRHVEA
jgi:hypothetical protein